MKRKIFTLLSAMLMLMFVFELNAQVPQALNYQAVARNSSGNILVNHTIGVKIIIHQGSASGTVVYSETHSVTTNQFGLFTLAVGQGTQLGAAFNTIVWSSGNYWLQVQMDPSGGATYADMGTSQLLTVPFAMYAANAAGTLPTGTDGQTLRHDGTNWVANSIIYNNGTKVGVGTTYPNTTFHINSASDVDPFRVQVNGSTKMFVGANGGTTLGIYSSGAPNGGLYVNGQTLIGVTSGTGGTLYEQGAKLQVQTTSKYAGYFSTDSLSSISYALYAKHTGSGNYDVRAMSGDAVAAPGYGIGGYFTGGFYGIRAIANATTYAYSAFGVYGSASGTAGTRYGVYGYASGGATNYGIYCSGNGAYTGTWTSASDEKFKKDVSEYTGALDNILKLKPVTYIMKTEEYPYMGFASGKQIGFIAQQMEKVFPTLVENSVHPGASKEDADIEYKGVNYIGLVPVLVKAIQEQQAEIETLKLQIKELQK